MMAILTMATRMATMPMTIDENDENDDSDKDDK